MRTERSPDPSPIQVVEAPGAIGRNLSDDAQAYVDSARRLELMALELAQRDIEEKEAVKVLIDATGGDVRVMKRAHRHCEIAMSDQWPAGPTLIRAFDYISAGRREMESNGSQDVPQRTAMVTTNRHSVQNEGLYDLVDEASIESFPASDAPSFWGR